MPSIPSAFVAFGITGDLMRLKVLPALYALHTKGALSRDFIIIGISRKKWSSAELHAYVADIVGHNESFLQRLQFVQGDIEEEGLFEVVSEKITDRAVLLYFSLSPALYKTAFKKLIRSPLAQKEVRILIEKPFGTDHKSASELNTLLQSAFTEKNIYRVDHYLAKESLQTLPPLEINNIRSIHLYFLEKAGVDKRGASYDAVGALRDVGQNHLLEMFATALHKNNRVAALKDLPILTAHQVATQTTHTQHAGYLHIPGVAAHSKTETYFNIETTWRNIPIRLEGGKYMKENRKAIVITYTDGTTAEFLMKENRGSSEYEQLIFACIRGDQRLFVSEQEVSLLWRFIDPIYTTWYGPHL